MQILVTCPLPQFALDELRSLGVELAYVPDLPVSDLPERIKSTGALIVGDAPVSPEALQNAQALQLIVHAGPGSGQVAVDEASARGIFVAHCPDRDARAVAEYAFGLLITLDRNVFAEEDAGDRLSLGLTGGCLGVISGPALLQELMQRAATFQMSVAHLAPESDSALISPTKPTGGSLCHWPRDVARCSNFLIVIERPGDEPIVDADFVSAMRDEAVLVYFGEASTLDETALIAAIEQRGVRVAIDRPRGPSTVRSRSRLLRTPGVVVTSGLAGATREARDSVAREIVRIISAFLISGEVDGAMNICERTPATWQLLLRVRDQVGVMAAILEAIRSDGINAEEVTSRVFTGAKAAYCVIALDERPSTHALRAIQALDDVLHFDLRAVV